MKEEIKKQEQDVVQVVKGAGINFFGTLLGNLLRFLYLFFLARILSQDDLGLYSLGLTILKFLVIVSLIGLDTGVVRFMALHHGKQDFGRMKGVLNVSLFISLPLSILVATGVFAFSEIISTDFFEKPELKSVIQIFSIGIPFFTATVIFLAGMQSLKKMQYKIYTRELGENIFKCIFTPVFIFLGFQLPGVIMANVVSFVLVAGLSYFYVKKIFSGYRIETEHQREFKPLLAYSFPNSISEITVRFIMWTDIFMLGYFSESKELGIYYVVTGIIFIGVLFVESFSMVFNPTIADLYNRNEHAQLSRLYKMVSKWIFITSLPFYLLIIFYAEPILNIYGEGFVSGALSMGVLGCAYIIYALTGLSGYVLLMTGKSWVNMMTNIFGCLLNVGLNYLLIPEYGILGAAWGTGLSLIAVNLLRLIEVYYLVQVHPFSRAFSKPLFSGLAALILMVITSKWMAMTNHYLDLLIGTCLFLGVYSLGLFLFGVDEEDMAILDKLRNKLTKSYVT